MFKRLFTYTVCIFTATMAFSQAVETWNSFEIGVGFREDDIQWKIHPRDDVLTDVSTKLKYTDQDIIVVRAAGETVLCDCLYARACADYGWVFQGKTKEDTFFISDIAQTNGKIAALSQRNVQSRPGLAAAVFDPENPVLGPNQAFQRLGTFNRSSGNRVADVDIAIGYPLEFNCVCSNLMIAPIVGYSYHWQHLRYINADNFPNIISTANNDVAQVPGPTIKSTFEASWYGPFIGFDFNCLLSDCWSFLGDFQYHIGRCKASSHRSVTGSLRNAAAAQQVDFATIAAGPATISESHSKTKDARGYSLSLAAKYAFFHCWTLGANFNYRSWNSHNHSNQLDWSGWGIGLDIGHMF